MGGALAQAKKKKTKKTEKKEEKAKKETKGEKKKKDKEDGGDKAKISKSVGAGGGRRMSQKSSKPDAVVNVCT